MGSLLEVIFGWVYSFDAGRAKAVSYFPATFKPLVLAQMRQEKFSRLCTLIEDKRSHHGRRSRNKSSNLFTELGLLLRYSALAKTGGAGPVL